MKKIAIAFDFKNNAEELLETSIKFCKHFNADLEIIHIDKEQKIDIPVFFSMTNPFNSEEEILQDRVNRDIIDQSKKRLDDLLDTFDFQGVKTHYTVNIGELDNLLTSSVDTIKPDLLIISTTDELDSDHFEPTTLLRVLDKISVPVLAIPSKTENFDLNKFVFAYDNDYELQNNLNTTREIAESLNADVLNLKIFVDEIEFRAYQEADGWMESTHDYSFVCPDIYSGLVGFFNGCNGSVLVLNHEKRNFISNFFHDSMTKKFLNDANVPLLIFDGDIKDWNLLS